MLRINSELIAAFGHCACWLLKLVQAHKKTSQLQELCGPLGSLLVCSLPRSNSRAQDSYPTLEHLGAKMWLLQAMEWPYRCVRGLQPVYEPHAYFPAA